MGEEGELSQSYIILGGGFAKTVIYRYMGVSKIDIFLLYNMWMATMHPYGLMQIN